MTLDSAAKQTLEAAFKNSPIELIIKDGMKLNYHDAGFYQTITQHIGYIQGLSKDLAKDIKNYAGVVATPIKNKIVLGDGTKSLGEVHLSILDLIGQPTWGGKDADSGVMMVTFMTPMRADLYPFMDAYLPDTLQFVTPGLGYRFGTKSAPGPYPRSLYGDRERLTFNGPIRLKSVMIVGDSRNPQGESWAIQCSGLATPWGTGAARPSKSPCRP